ncbi:hypothetical protein RSOL_432810, partial [Rhizoctonia solani AG-3 Rhs1AP]
MLRPTTKIFTLSINYLVLASAHSLLSKRFNWQDFSPAYPPGTMPEYHSVSPNDTFSPGLPSATSGLSDMSYTTYDGPYSGVDGIQVHFFGPPHTHAPPPTADLNAHVQSISSGTRMHSLASLAFNRTNSTQ